VDNGGGGGIVDNDNETYRSELDYEDGML